MFFPPFMDEDELVLPADTDDDELFELAAAALSAAAKFSRLREEVR